jgi:hypothetical protein
VSAKYVLWFLISPPQLAVLALLALLALITRPLSLRQQ